MNLAASLEGAAARDPEREALVQRDAVRLTYADLADRAARLARGLAALGLRRGDRLAVVLDNRHETVELYWAAQWLGAVYVPLSWRLSDEELDYCIGDCGAALVGRMDDAGVTVGDAHFDALVDADPLPPALDLDEREPSLMLYTSGTTGRPKGVPRSHRADRAGGLSQALQHGLRFGDRTLGVMPLYHTMGLHSLVAM
ncbi:MAG: AMP-binding protein, partial [Actinobacteria bacterium]|nr:AMP-binding protein [Actinomycetota bacterium]